MAVPCVSCYFPPPPIVEIYLLKKRGFGAQQIILGYLYWPNYFKFEIWYNFVKFS